MYIYIYIYIYAAPLEHITLHQYPRSQQATLLHAAKLMVISLCGDSSKDPYSVDAESTAKDSKDTASLVKKFSFLTSKLQAATSSGTLSSPSNQ